MTLVKCETGLGNRVAAMANALSRSGAVQFHWVKNKHCPASAVEIFPGGIQGIELIDSEAAERPPGIGEQRGQCSIWNGTPCFKWEACGDRDRANEAYSRIIAAMAGSAITDAPAVAIHGRFHINPEAKPAELAECAAEAALAAGDLRVFILSDRYRSELAGRVSALGILPIMAGSSELSDDLAREETGMVDYLSDWKTLIAADHLFYTRPRISSALYPIRARFGHP